MAFRSTFETPTGVGIAEVYKEDQTMALKHGDEHYTMFTFTENGQVMNRRLHKLEIQDRTGKVHILEGKLLPNVITASTGQGQKGHHVATILLNPESAKSLIPSQDGYAWPTHRDVLHGLAAVVLFMMMQRFVHIASALP